jgi:hypothetical protein
MRSRGDESRPMRSIKKKKRGLRRWRMMRRRWRLRLRLRLRIGGEPKHRWSGHCYESLVV